MLVNFNYRNKLTLIIIEMKFMKILKKKKIELLMKKNVYKFLQKYNVKVLKKNVIHLNGKLAKI